MDYVVRCAIFFDRRLESDLPQPDDTGQHGIGEALTVLGFILTQAIAVVISQVGRPALYKASWWDLGGLAVLYGAVTLAILGAAVRMLQSTRVVCDRRRRTYDGGTIRFMKYVVCCGVAMAVLIPPLALLGILPAQGPTGPVQLDWTGISGKIPAVDEDLKELQDPDLVGKPAIRIEIQISPSDFRGEIPKSLTTKVAIAPAVLDKGWRVFDAEIFVGEPAKKIKHFPAPLVPAQIRDLNSTLRHSFGLGLSQLSSRESYTLVLWLYKKNASEGDAATYAAELNRQKEKEKPIVVQATWTG